MIAVVLIHADRWSHHSGKIVRGLPCFLGLCGRFGNDDPNLALLVVTTNRAEYWASPNGALLQAFGFVKAAVTGTRISSGEHETIG